jgi:hypothetical protein
MANEMPATIWAWSTRMETESGEDEWCEWEPQLPVLDVLSRGLLIKPPTKMVRGDAHDAVCRERDELRERVEATRRALTEAAAHLSFDDPTKLHIEAARIEMSRTLAALTEVPA